MFIPTIQSKAIIVGIGLVTATTALADPPKSPVELGRSPGRKNPTTNASAEVAYDRFMRAERSYYNKKNIIERGISGGAALLIGFYGYYNDKRGPISSVVYSLTQTAGVYLVSQSIFDRSHSSLFLSLDQSFRQKGEMKHVEFKHHFADYEQKRHYGEVRKNSYMTGALAAIYAVNGLNESTDAIRNTYYFAAANLLLISTVNFAELYKLNAQNPLTKVSLLPSSNGIQMTMTWQLN